MGSRQTNLNCCDYTPEHAFVGTSEIKKTYDTFANIKFSVEFKVLEVDVVAPE